MEQDQHEPDGTNGVATGKPRSYHTDLTLLDLIRRMEETVLASNGGDSTVFQRVKRSVSENAPLLKEASTNSSRQILRWTQEGSVFRALLVISVGTITILSLSGLFVFMLFFLAATINAIVISLIVSLAAAGGFLALFFACVAAVYIATLSVAAFVISTVTISLVVTVLIASGWIGFFCLVWLVTKKSVSVARHSLSATGSAISAYSGSSRVEAEKSE